MKSATCCNIIWGKASTSLICAASGNDVELTLKWCCSRWSQWCDVCLQMWRSHASFAKRTSLGVAVIICRRQTSFKKRTFVSRQKCVFCFFKRVKRSKIEVKAKKRSTFSCCLLDKLEFICRHLSILLCTANHPRPINSVVRHLINKHLPTPLINEFLQAR